MAVAWEDCEADVLVVGAGAAGLRAAIEAAAGACRVVVASKSLLGKAATVLESAPLAGDLPPEQRERIAELEALGALPIASRGARIGLEALRTLQHRAVAAGVDVHMECAIHRLFVASGRIAGALGVRRADGALVLYRCSAVVLACGGAARLWRDPTANADATGDGLALALDAGAELDRAEVGIRVDAATGATRVPGLFAAGDAAARAPEGHALLAALCAGRAAGGHAAAHARVCSRMPLSVAQIEQAAASLLQPLGTGGGESPYALLAELQECMHRNAATLRAIDDLKARAARLRVPGPRTWNPAWHLALELRSLLVASEALVRAAQERAGAPATEAALKERHRA